MTLQDHQFGSPELPDNDQPVGRIVSVTGSQAIALLFHSLDDRSLQPEMGTLLKVDTPASVVLCLVSALSAPAPTAHAEDAELWIAELELVGELFKNEEGVAERFRRGVMVYPKLGDHIYMCSREELRRAYSWDNEETIRIGKIHQDHSIDAVVRVNEMLGKHFAVLGSTGTGKSCSAALLLRQILKKNPHGHVVLIDPHNEYSASFADMAEIISTGDLQLPFWFLTFDEIVEVLVGDRLGKEKEVEILADLIPMAKARYANQRRGHGRMAVRVADTANFSVDSPLPYRISDMMDLINEFMGKLELKNNLAPFKALKARLEAVTSDIRYSFMFGALTVQDQMATILGRLFRVPVAGRPITIIEMTGLPAEVINVAVSVLARMTFDFALWSEGAVPITIVCEEAHRYIPVDSRLGFEPTKRSIARIAKEGRKYGVSLGIISQRPSELDPTILSQCNTQFVMRMANDLDQKIVLAAISDAASSLMEFLPSLGTGECIAFGDGMTLPVRMRFDRLPPELLPRSSTAKFTESWRRGFDDPTFLEAVIERWRAAGTPTAGFAERRSADPAAQPGEAPVAAAGETRFSETAAPEDEMPQWAEPDELPGMAELDEIDAGAAEPAAAAVDPVPAASPRRGPHPLPGGRSTRRSASARRCAPRAASSSSRGGGAVPIGTGSASTLVSAAHFVAAAAPVHFTPSCCRVGARPC
jgi:DNA helicase HerA-like ATPase